MNRMLKLLILVVFLFSALYVFAAPKGKHVGIVNRLQGKAVVYHNGETQPQTLEVGSKVYENDKIVTEKNAKVQVVLRNDCVFTAGEESELVITKDMYSKITGKRETVVSLLKGKLRSVVGKNYRTAGSKYEVHTRTAIAGVRGTQNLVEANDNPPSTNVYGIENKTNVKNSNNNVQGNLDVGPGNGARVPLNGPPEPFDFDFNDPSLRGLLGGTTVGGGSNDVEDDINMGSFMGGPAGFGGSETPDLEPYDIERRDRNETPPFDQSPDQREDVHDSPHHDPQCGSCEG